MEEEKGEQKVKGEENMREWDGQDEGRTERESKETDIFIEQAIMVLARNLALGKFPGIHRMTPN